MSLNQQLCLANVRQLLNKGDSLNIYNGKVPVSGYVFVMHNVAPGQGPNTTLTVTTDNTGSTTLNPGEVFGISGSITIDVKNDQGPSLIYGVCLFYSDTASIEK